MYFVVRNLLSRLDPDAANKEEARQKSIAANRKLKGILARQEDDEDDEEQDTIRQRLHRDELVLTPYEQSIAMEVVAPEEIPVTFDGNMRIWNASACAHADTLSQTSEDWRILLRS